MADAQKIEPKQPAPLVVLRDQLMSRAQSFQTALPPHMSAERFIRVIITAVQLNPDLLACDRQTLFNSAMRCANDGLIPDGNEAALVPFKSKVQYLAMYRGLLKKFRNSGQFKWVTAGIVYEGEEYEHYIDETGEHFRHVPGDDNEGKKIRRVYALATTKDGGSFIADMSMAEVNKRKAMSRASREDAPWRQWPDEMMKKTAIRVLSRLLPMSSDLDALIKRDEEALLGVEAVDDTRAQIGERPTTQATLDHFAGSDSAVASSPSAERAEGASSQANTPAPEAGASSIAAEPASTSSDVDRSTTTATSEAGGGDTPQASPPLSSPRELGRAAFHDGKKRREVPEEFRQASNSSAALEWTAGFDEEQAKQRK